MRFTLIDRIVELEPGARIKAIKALSMAEEYLGDHFPLFPVLPGVLMLEALTQAGAWLVRSSEDFAHSLVVLKEARNVKYADFVEPGRILTVTVEITKWEPRLVHLKAQGTLDGVVALSAARLVIERYNLAEERGDGAAVDEYTKRYLRNLFSVLYRPGTTAPGGADQAVATAS
jgi:3-hydroxyacyl-[acyl-carrier-protein] dehydratase